MGMPHLNPLEREWLACLLARSRYTRDMPQRSDLLFAAGSNCQRLDNTSGICLFSDVRCEIVVFGKPIRFIHFLSIPVLVRCALIPENSLI